MTRECLLLTCECISNFFDKAACKYESSVTWNGAMYISVKILILRVTPPNIPMPEMNTRLGKRFVRKPKNNFRTRNNFWIIVAKPGAALLWFAP